MGQTPVAIKLLIRDQQFEQKLYWKAFNVLPNVKKVTSSSPLKIIVYFKLILKFQPESSTYILFVLF